MSPPIFNPDGSEVSEIVLPDGSTASQVIGPDGNVVFEAGPDIPDSAIAHYDAQTAFASGDDGNSISTWPDELGNYAVSGGSPTVRENGINGYRSLQFNGTNDALDNASPSLGQPNTVISVVEFLNSDSTQDAFILDSESSETHQVSQGRFKAQNIAAKSRVEGNTTVTGDPLLITGIFDGSNSVLRENGTQTGSGDVGSNSLNGIAVGRAYDSPSGRLYDGYIGELVICDGRLSSSEILDEESRLADKWGLTLY